MSNNDYSERYSEDYLRRVAVAHFFWERMARDRCVCCLRRKSEEMHHTSYGSDQMGTNWFPVCKRCHKDVCHSSKNWVRYRDKERALLGNHNKSAFVEFLRKNYKMLLEQKVKK